MVGSLTRKYGRGREAHPEVWECREAHPYVRVRSVGPRGGPGGVGRPIRRSQRSLGQLVSLFVVPQEVLKVQEGSGRVGRPS